MKTTEIANELLKIARELKSREKIALDRHTLDQLVEMAGESMEYDDWKGMEADRNVINEARKFERDLKRVLQQWVGRNRHRMKNDSDDDTLFDAKGPFLVLMTLRGEGVGIWDGDWDEFFVTPNKDIPDLEKFLKQRLGNYADSTGSGSLNEAFMDAAAEQHEGEEE